MKFKLLFAQKRNLKILLITIVLIIICVFLIRGFFLRKAIASVTNRLNYHGYTAYWNEVKFKGIRTVFIKEIYVKSQHDNNEVVFDTLSVTVKLLPLFIKNFRIKKIICNSVSIRYFSNDSVITVAKNKKNVDLGNPFSNLDFAGFAYKNIRRFFHYVPQRIYFGTINLKYTYAGNLSVVNFNDLELKKNGLLNAKLVFGRNDSSHVIPLYGKLDKGAFFMELHMVNISGSHLPIPVLQDKYGISSGFDSLKILLDLSTRNRQLVSIKGLFNFSGFELNGKRISTDTIKINSFKSSFRIMLGDDFIEIDSSSVGYLNEIRLNPYLKLSFRPNSEITFKILPQTWASDKFFRSLPEGMFTSVTDIKTEGLLNYYLNFHIDLNNPDSLYFDTRFTSDDFKILSYGTDDYRILNSSFQHKAYEKGRLVATFAVGPANPDFVDFSDISPYLRSAVMTSEDGSFFYHNGFNPGAFRESIVTNIREKRFARGGSTITMQLVKNVFLTRNKTLARKIEEALIVWMIEGENLVSKERMYEVYLNIIEWGPGIYGINQASHFYFNKKPSELNLSESIYLASIVPHPKWYKYSFIDNGELKPFYSSYFNRMKELMVRKRFINPYDTVGVPRDVLLTGSASGVFASDTIVLDSLIQDLLFIPPEF